jgi:hypothetical protein
LVNPQTGLSVPAGLIHRPLTGAAYRRTAAKQGTTMVELTSYARSLEADITFIRGIVAKFEAGAYQSGLRATDKPWVDTTPQMILFYKRMLFTFEATLAGVKTRLAQTEIAGTAAAPVSPPVH